MTVYRCVEQRFYREELGEYMTYGIDISGGAVIDDVAADRQLVERLVDRFNCLQLAPMHVMDVLEDEL